MIQGEGVEEVDGGPEAVEAAQGGGEEGLVDLTGAWDCVDCVIWFCFF